MTVFENEQIICCDIDDTMVLWGSLGEDYPRIEIPCPYNQNIIENLGVHSPHVKLVHDRLERGALMIVWSAGGYAWARNVMQALGFMKYPNVHIYSKPIAYIDDKKCDIWMGEHIYLKPDSAWGSKK